MGSSPRAGTTLLAEAMATCFRIDNAVEHESFICTDEPPNGNCMLTKQPGEIGAVGLPLRLNPDLYVVCLMRDPRDAVVSFHGTRPDVYWCSLKYWKLFVRKYRKLIRHDRFVVIRYEDFVNKPNTIQDELMRRIPFLEKLHDFSQYHLYSRAGKSSQKAMRGVRAIAPASVGVWKKHLPRIKEQMKTHGDISGDLIEFGYEPDREWLSSLKDVEPGRFVTHTDGFFTWRFILRRKTSGLREAVNILIRRTGLDPIRVFGPQGQISAGLGRVVVFPRRILARGRRVIRKLISSGS